VIPRSGTSDIEQMPLGVVDLLQVRVVRDRFDALLKRQNAVIAGHHHDGPKHEALRQVRCQ